MKPGRGPGRAAPGHSDGREAGSGRGSRLERLDEQEEIQLLMQMGWTPSEDSADETHGASQPECAAAMLGNEFQIEARTESPAFGASSGNEGSNSRGPGDLPGDQGAAGAAGSAAGKRRRKKKKGRSGLISAGDEHASTPPSGTDAAGVIEDGSACGADAATVSSPECHWPTATKAVGSPARTPSLEAVAAAGSAAANGNPRPQTGTSGTGQHPVDAALNAALRAALNSALGGGGDGTGTSAGESTGAQQKARKGIHTPPNSQPIDGGSFASPRFDLDPGVADQLGELPGLEVHAPLPGTSLDFSKAAADAADVTATDSGIPELASGNDIANGCCASSCTDSVESPPRASMSSAAAWLSAAAADSEGLTASTAVSVREATGSGSGFSPSATGSACGSGSGGSSASAASAGDRGASNAGLGTGAGSMGAKLGSQSALMPPAAAATVAGEPEAAEDVEPAVSSTSAHITARFPTAVAAASEPADNEGTNRSIADGNCASVDVGGTATGITAEAAGVVAGSIAGSANPTPLHAAFATEASPATLPVSGTMPPPAPLPGATGDDTKCVYIVNKDFEEENSKYYNGAAVEMSVRVGEMVRVEQFDVEWWYCCKLDRHGRGTAERGWVPECFLSVPSEYASANRMKLRDKIRKSAQQRRGVAR